MALTESAYWGEQKSPASFQKALFDPTETSASNITDDVKTLLQPIVKGSRRRYFVAGAGYPAGLSPEQMPDIRVWRSTCSTL
jgi:hypothetical protein